jgi:type II secretory pathway pseudopilin PulG
MAALLIAISVMGILMTVVMPVWKQEATREKETELVFRGQQYVHAIQLFQRQAGPGAYPPSFDFLVQQKFLRKKYKDPITGKDFDPVPAVSPVTQGSAPPIPGTGAPSSQGTSSSGTTAVTPVTAQVTVGIDGTVAGGIAGVVSKSTDQSIRIYNGQTHYNEWVFRALPQSPTAGGQTGPAGAGQRGGQGNQPGPGGVGGGGVAGRGRGRGQGPQRFGGPNNPNGGGATTPNGRGFVTLPDGRVVPVGGGPNGGQPRGR